MKKKLTYYYKMFIIYIMKDNIKLFISFFIVYLLFKNSFLITNEIINSSTMFFYIIFPSTFINLLLMDVLYYLNFPYHLHHILKIPYKYILIILSFISGTPSNIYLIKNLYLNNYIDKEEVKNMISYTFFINPFFLYTMLNKIFNFRTSILLIVIPLLINIVKSLFLKDNFELIIKPKKESLFIYIINSVKNNINTLLNILGSIILINIINILINKSNNLILTGILEITKGLNLVINSNLVYDIKLILVTFFINFGGLSIITQAYSIIDDKNISYLSIIKGRIASSFIAIMIIIILNTI